MEMATYHENALEIIRDNYLYYMDKEYKSFAINIKLYEFTHTISSLLFDKHKTDVFVDFGGSHITYSDLLDMLADYEGDESLYTNAAENALKNYISVFEDYLKEILEFLFNSYPHHIFKEKTTLPTKRLLEHDTLESLKDTLIKEKVTSVSFENLVEVISFIEKEFKVDLDTPIDILECLTEITLIRNILVHNKGIVNEIFLKKVKGKHHFVEKPYALGVKVVVHASEMGIV